MRNALVILVVAGLFSVVGSTPAFAFGTLASDSVVPPADISAEHSIYAPPPLSSSGVSHSTNPVDQLLPVRGSDLPISSSSGTVAGTSSGSQISVVEAIPTPTAFHTGGFLLLAIFVGRYFRKLRLN